jgi:hypothetical protein
MRADPTGSRNDRSLPPISGGLAYPQGVAIDASGKLFVANYGAPFALAVY